MTEKDCLNKYLGIPYKHLGRSLEGLDCYGIIILVYKDLGYELMDLSDYNKHWAVKGEDLFVQNYQKQWERVEQPQLFDVILFKGVKGIANHAGIYFSPDRFMHCMEAGVVVGHLSDEHWGKNVEGYFRLKK